MSDQSWSWTNFVIYLMDFDCQREVMSEGFLAANE